MSFIGLIAPHAVGAQTFYAVDSSEKVQSRSVTLIGSSTAPPIKMVVLSGDGAKFKRIGLPLCVMLSPYKDSNWYQSFELDSVSAVSGDTLTISKRKLSNSQQLAWAVGTLVTVQNNAGVLIKQLQTRIVSGLSGVLPDSTGKTSKVLEVKPGGGYDWIAQASGAVASFNTRTGAVVSANGDYSFGQLSGTAAVTQGGTGLSSIAATRLLYTSSLNTLAPLTLGTGLSITSATLNVGLGSFTTSDLAEGTNLYYTDARARAAITGTAPISVSSGVVSETQASTITDGYLTAGDWTTFNSKQNALTLPLSIANGGTHATTAAQARVNLLPDTTGHTSEVLTVQTGGGFGWTAGGGGGGSGTVTSIGVSAPSEIDVTGSPVTTSGTIAIAWADEAQNSVFAGPSGGGAGTPNFRSLVSGDIPNLDFAKITTGTVPVTQGGTGQTTYTDGQLLIGKTAGNTLQKSTLTAGTGISVTNGSGAVTLANTGVTSLVAGTGVSVSGATGAVTVSNTGVTSLAGTADEVIVSAGSGAVTLSTPQPIAVTSSPTFLDLDLNDSLRLNDGTLTSTETLVDDTVRWGFRTSGGPVTETMTLDATNGVLKTPSYETSAGYLKSVGETYYMPGGQSGATLATDGDLATETTNRIAGDATTLSDAETYADGLVPLTTRGDLVTRNASTNVRLPIGAANRVLTSDGTDASWGQVDLTTSAVTGILTSANGGTGSGFTKFSGPATTEKTFTLPNASATLAYLAGGQTFTGGLTINGGLTLGTALSIANGGTGQTTANTALNALLPTQSGHSGEFLTSDGTNTSWASVAGSGTVTSIDVSGGATGLTTSGGPVTTSGTVTLAGTLDADNGGTGQSTYSTGDVLYASSSSALSKLSVGTDGQILTLASGLPSWAAAPAGGVTSVFSRTGAVTAQSGDYTASQVTNAAATNAANTFSDVVQTVTKPDIRTTYTDALRLSNPTAADGTNTIQQSPSLVFKSNVWNTTPTAATNTFDAREALVPTSGASPSAKLSWAFNNNGGGYSEKLSLTSAGNLTAATFTGNLTGDVTGNLTGNVTGNASGTSANVTGVVAIANGGTGQTTATASFDALSPVTTRGDLIYRNATTNARLAVGAANRVLHSDGTDPSWAQVTLTTDVTGTLPVTNGGTGTATAFTSGSVVYAGASGVYAQDNTNLFYDAANAALYVGGVTSRVLAISSFEAAGTASSGMSITARHAKAGSSFPGFTGVGSRGTLASPTATQLDDCLGFLAGVGRGSSAWSGNAAIVKLFAGENFSNSAQGTYITLETTPTSSTTRAERVRVDPSGRLLVGETASANTGGVSGTQFLEVATAAASGTSIGIRNANAGSAPLNVFRGMRNHGGTTAATPTAISSGDNIAALGGVGCYASSSWSTSDNGLIGIWAAQDFTSSNQGTYLTFETTVNGNTATNRAERVRIDDVGRMGIGQTSPTAYLHLAAGSATANKGALKMASGTNLTTPEAGSVEYDGTYFYVTPGSTRFNLVPMTAAGDIIYGGTSGAPTRLAVGSTNALLTVSGGNPAWTTTPSLGTTTFTGALNVKVIAAVVNAASPYTVGSGDCVVPADCSGGAITINLPAATGTGRVIIVQKFDNSINAVTVHLNGSDGIVGVVGDMTLASQGSQVTLIDEASAKWLRQSVI